MSRAAPRALARSRRRGPHGARGSIPSIRGLVDFLRANPQVFVLLLVCLVLGIGTFIAVLVAVVGSGSTTASGEPSGLILGLRGMLA